MNWSLLRKFGKRIRALRPLPVVAPRGRRRLTLEHLEGRDLPAAPPLQFFYSPLPENDMRLAEAALGATPDNLMVSITSFTASSDGTIVYYDEWEDGYEADLGNPTQPTTKVWGDGNAANGAAPGLPGDLINAGDVVTLRNNVTVNPRIPPAGPIPIFFDGGDRIGASRTLAMTRAMWNDGVDTVLAHSVGVFDTRYAGTSFTAPVGTNTASAGSAFEYSTLFVQATQNGTNVSVDVNGDGSVIETATLNQGQTYVTTNTVRAGARVTSNRPVQVFEFTGDVGARFESRMYNVFPDARLSNDYYSPVFSTTGVDSNGNSVPVNVQVFVHNPGAAAITVNVETTAGTVPLNVPARSTVATANIPTGSAVHLSSGGPNFSAVFVNDSGADGSIWDWGSTLQPTNQLSPIAVLAWAPGDRNTPVPLNNYSAVWLTATANTTVYVDYDGDPGTGANVDAFGNRYDTTVPLTRLQAVQLTDTDHDMTRMRLYTLDGTNLSVAWGENASVAPIGAPAMDLGTTVPAFPVPYFSKTVRLLTDANGDGSINSGDTLRYTLTVQNSGVFPITNAVVLDTLPVQLQYVPGTALIDGTPIPDAGASPFPLDEAGYTVVNLNIGQTTVITFDTLVSPGLASGTTTVTNAGVISVGITIVQDEVTSDVRGAIGDTVYNDVNRNGTQDGTEPGLANVTLSLFRDANGNGTYQPGVDTLAGTRVTDPTGHYVFGDLDEATYFVVVTDTNGVVTGATLTGGTSPRTVVVGAGTAIADADFGFAFPTDLVVTKSGPASVVPGTNLTYTITVSNAGQSTALGVSVTDALPAGTTFVSLGQSGSPTFGTVTPSVGANGTVTLTAADLPVGASVTFTLVVRVGPGVTTTLSNTATGTTTTPESNTGNNSQTATTPVTPEVDLSITNDDGVTEYTAGSGLTYTIVVANAGPSNVTGATVKDTLPAALTGATWTVAYSPGASGTPNGTGDINATVNLPVGGTATFTLNVGVRPTATGPLTTTATVAAPLGVTDTNLSNNSADDTDAQAGTPDLTLSKTDGRTNAAPGDVLVYTLTYQNAGNRGATGVVITETLPAGTTFDPLASTGTWVNVGGGVYRQTIGPVAAGAGGSTTFAVRVNATAAAGRTQIVNNASVADDGLNGSDPTPLDNSASDTDTLDAAPDLAVSKSDGVLTARPGDTLTYTITVTNNGDQDATGVVLTDTLPTNTSFVGATGSGTPGVGTVTWTVGNLAAGASVSFDVTVTVNAAVPAGATAIANSAHAADDGNNGPDPTPLDNTGTDTDTLDAAPDLVVTKSDGATSATPGGTLTYTITIRNNGNQGAAGVVLTDTLPANTTFAGATGGGSFSGGTVTWNIGPVAAGATVTRTVTVTVNATVPAGVTSLTNSARAADDGANGPDPTPLDNTGTDTDTLDATPDLVVTVTDGGVTAQPGGTVTYTITVTNVGDQDATGVTLTSPVPTYTTFTSASVGGSAAGGSVTWTIGSLAAGATVTRTLTVTVDPTVPAGVTDVTDTATAADDGANGPDPTPANNTASDPTPLDAAPDLVVTKTDGVPTARPGDTLTYTITVRNTGNRGATGVVLSDTLPANTTFVSATAGSSVAGGVVTWGVGGLAAGASASYSVTVQVNATVPTGVTSLVNSATAADDGTNGSDPNPGDNTGTDTDTLDAAPDLTLTKSDGVTTTTPGTTLTYTLTYANAGTQDATGVVLTETLPAGTAFDPLANPGWVDQGGGVYTFAVGNLAAGANGTAAFVVTVISPAVAGQTQVVNSASVADDGANGSDPNPGDNGATDTDTLDAAPDLVVTKTDGATSVRPGDTVTYTITVTNAGSQDATGVTLTDRIPGLTTFVGATGKGTFARGTVTWTVGNLAAGASVSFDVTVQIDAAVPAGTSTLVNSATATDDGTNGPDPNPTDNTGTDTDDLDAGPDLTLTKSDGLTVVIPGSSVVYTLSYANAGNQDATGVALVETLPAGTAFDPSRSTPGWVDRGNGTLTLAVGTLAAGANGTVTFAVTVNRPAPAGQATVINSALVIDDGTNGRDPNPGDNTATDTDALNRLPVAVNDTAATTQDAPVTITSTALLANDDQGDAPAAVVAVSPTSTAGGTVVLGPNGVVYTPPANFSGTDTFTYTIRDQNGDTSTATVTVVVVPLGRAGEADGRVWLDFDADGTQDADEPGIPGVTLTLTRAGRDNDFATTADNLTFTTVTGPDGGYSFGLLTLGLHRVAVTGGLPAGTRLTFDPDGGADELAAFALADGQRRDGLDFGYRGLSRLAGTVFTDYQVNGVFDPTAPTPEVGVPGITVTLTGTDAAGNVITRTAVSGADGSFAFGGLLAGTYRLTETPPPPVTQPGGYYDGLEAAGAAGGIVGPNTIGSIALGTGVNGDGYGFGVNPPADPFGYVYVDRNHNGRRDPGEAGIPGVTITVSGVAFAGTPLSRTLSAADVPGGLTVTTDADGRWEYRIIPPGTYSFAESQPAGYIDGPEEDADPNGPFTVSVGNDVFGNVVLTPTPVRGPFNFAEILRPGPVGPLPPMDFFPLAPVDPSKRMFLGSTVTPRAIDTTTLIDPNFAAFSPGPRPAAFLATGEDLGGGWVRVFDFAAGSERFRLRPFGDFAGGVRVAVADVTGDGIPDLIAAAGPGGGPVVKVIDGNTGNEVGSVMAFEAGFRGGLRVAAGDVNGDGFADIVVTPDVGGGPIVRVFDGRTLAQVANFFALDETFRGGLRIAAGDINRDGAADLVVTAGIGGGPRVAVYDGRSLAGVPARIGNDFFGFAPELRNGFWVSAGDADGDGFADVVLGAGDGGGARAAVYSGRGLSSGGGAVMIGSVLAGDEGSRSGAQVAAVDLDGDGRAELAAAGGSDADPIVYLIDPLTGVRRDMFRAFPSDATGGVSLG